MVKNLLRRLYGKAYSIVGNRKLTKTFPFLMTIHCYIMNKLKPSKNVIDVDGLKMLLHREKSATSAALSVLGIVEPLTMDTIKINVKRGDIALDLGANIGYHTLILSKLVGKTGKVFAFEPAPENAALIRENIKINNIKNVVVIEMAVSDKKQKSRLYLDYNQDSHSLYKNKNSKYIEIETTTLDDFFENYNGKINFIKMDVQGAEYKVLKGGYKTIQKNKKIKIIAEYEPVLLKAAGIDPIEFLRFIKRANFVIYNINQAERNLEELKEDKFERFTRTLSETENTNLFLVR